MWTWITFCWEWRPGIWGSVPTGIQAKGEGGRGQRMAMPQILYKLEEIMPRKVSKQIRWHSKYLGHSIIPVRKYFELSSSSVQVQLLPCFPYVATALLLELLICLIRNCLSFLWSQTKESSDFPSSMPEDTWNFPSSKPEYSWNILFSEPEESWNFLSYTTRRCLLLLIFLAWGKLKHSSIS